MALPHGPAVNFIPHVVHSFPGRQHRRVILKDRSSLKSPVGLLNEGSYSNNSVVARTRTRVKGSYNRRISALSLYGTVKSARAQISITLKGSSTCEMESAHLLCPLYTHLLAAAPFALHLRSKGSYHRNTKTAPQLLIFLTMYEGLHSGKWKLTHWLVSISGYLDGGVTSWASRNGAI